MVIRYPLIVGVGVYDGIAYCGALIHHRPIN
jgi:hypothetical protein